MKLRASLKYQLYGNLKATAIFYGVVIVLNAFSASLVTLAGNISFSGADISTVVFAFALGLNAYRESFRMMAVNGRTRRTAFSSIVLAALIVSACLAVFDMLLQTVFSPFFDRYGTLYDFLYGKPQTIGGLFTEFGWHTALYCTVMLTGVWLNSLYFRMSKPLKIGVSVGVPALLFYALVKLYFANDGIGRVLAAVVRAVAIAVRYMFGFDGIAPQPAMFCLWGMVLALAAAGIFWACMRRAEVRE